MTFVHVYLERGCCTTWDLWADIGKAKAVPRGETALAPLAEHKVTTNKAIVAPKYTVHGHTLALFDQPRKPPLTEEAMASSFFARGWPSEA